jgi:hypothetical protein
MPETWKDLCPIDEEKRPIQRQAWRGGWLYRMERGPGLGEEEKPAVDRTLEKYNSSVLSAWLQGYSAANSYLREKKSEQAGRGDT